MQICNNLSHKFLSKKDSIFTENLSLVECLTYYPVKLKITCKTVRQKYRNFNEILTFKYF